MRLAVSIFEFQSPYFPYPYHICFLSPFGPRKNISAPNGQITAFSTESEAALHHYAQPTVLSAIYHSTTTFIDDSQMLSSATVSVIS
jgi:hypothetical protein